MSVVVEHQPVVDFSCDREGRLVGVSPVVTLFGWNPEELQSVAAFDLVQPADRARAAVALHTVVLQPGAPAVRAEAAVYKIVEEALTNVMRHASARSVPISLDHGGGTLTVVIADDGEIQSAPGQGTVVEATLAVPPEVRR